MRNTPTDLLRYIQLRRRGASSVQNSYGDRQIALGGDAVGEDDLHGGRLLPALHKVLRNRKKTLADEFSYSQNDLETLDVECGDQTGSLYVTICGRKSELRRSIDGEHDRHWHILFEVGMTLNVLRYNHLVCTRVRQIALYPCPTPHPIAADEKWFVIKSRRNLDEVFLKAVNDQVVYSAISAVLGLPAGLNEFSHEQQCVNDVANRNGELLSTLCNIVRRAYPDYWLPDFRMVSINGGEGAAMAARDIAQTPNADRLLVQAQAQPVRCLRRDIEGAWWLFNSQNALPTRAGALAVALTACRIEDGALVAPFRAPLAVDGVGQITKWGQLHAHHVMTKNLLQKAAVVQSPATGDWR
ncbi:MAG TPA: hypothetical protein VIF60_23240 [Burkholderiaceae bacterium]|jgi:hypothetical protein